MSPWLRVRRRMKALMMQHVPGMITCAEFEAFMLDYHEGGLTDRQRQVFERHMAQCPPCATSLANYRKAVALGQQLFADAARHDPAPVDERLVQSILAARRAQ